MSKRKTTIKLAPSMDIPFDKLKLSSANVRQIRSDDSIRELAEDIARRGLLQGLSVRTELDGQGKPTGIYTIPAGGRRFRALDYLVQQKRLSKTTPIPCILHDDGIEEEDSLAENIQRAPLHPLDQFRAFLALREKGQSEEDIAAHFFVSTNIVKQRLKLASISNKILDAFGEDQISLELLMAFAVCDDHEHQEQVFDWLMQAQAYERQPANIKHMLTEHHVRAHDKRALFVGLDAYQQAGGGIIRDLFDSDFGGWLDDAALLNSMVQDKLQQAADQIRNEGWLWIEAALTLPFGITHGMRQIKSEAKPMSDDEEAKLAALLEEQQALEDQYGNMAELPDEIDQKLGEIEQAIEAIQDRPLTFDESYKAIAGAFIAVNETGKLVIQRGFIRPEDEPEVDGDDANGDNAGDIATIHGHSDVRGAASGAIHGGQLQQPEEPDPTKQVSDKLIAELATSRTVALANRLSQDFDLAFLTNLHAMSLWQFYNAGLDSCLDLAIKRPTFNASPPELASFPPAKNLSERHQTWLQQLPQDSQDLWDCLKSFDHDSRQALFAHCTSLCLNAAIEPHNRQPRAIAHAGKLACELKLDMHKAGWRASADNYLGRISKAQIIDVVTEACGEAKARSLTKLKKPDMVTAAETLLADTDWLPEPLRTMVEEPVALAAE